LILLFSSRLSAYTISEQNAALNYFKTSICNQKISMVVCGLSGPTFIDARLNVEGSQYVRLTRYEIAKGYDEVRKISRRNYSSRSTEYISAVDNLKGHARFLNYSCQGLMGACVLTAGLVGVASPPLIPLAAVAAGVCTASSFWCSDLKDQTIKEAEEVLQKLKECPEDDEECIYLTVKSTYPWFVLPLPKTSGATSNDGLGKDNSRPIDNPGVSSADAIPIEKN
jgi:hypothetical protein